MELVFYPNGDGLSKVFKDYQEEALKIIWQNAEGTTSRLVWENVNANLGEGRSMSRASIIKFMNDMVDMGVIDYHEESCKGYYRNIYKPKMHEKELKIPIVKTILFSLMRDFPEETRAAIDGFDT